MAGPGKKRQNVTVLRLQERNWRCVGTRSVVRSSVRQDRLNHRLQLTVCAMGSSVTRSNLRFPLPVLPNESPMRCFRPFAAVLLSASALFGASQACAQSPNASTSLDQSIIASSAVLTEAQKTAIKAFAQTQVQLLATANDQAELESARRILTDAPRDPAATAIFRRGYSTVLIPLLTPVASGTDLRRAIFAMQALRFLRSNEAVDALLNRASLATEKDGARRLVAAGLAADLLSDADLSPIQMEAIAKRLGICALAETDSFALQQQLEGFNALLKRSQLPADTAKSVRKSEFEAIALLASSIAQQPNADARMNAVYRALISVRNQWVEMPTAEKTAAAPQLARGLVDLLKASDKQWTSVRANANLSPSYAGMCNSAEVLLRLVDRSMRPNAPRSTDDRVLPKTWESADKAAFTAEVKRWSDAVATYK